MAKTVFKYLKPEDIRKLERYEFAPTAPGALRPKEDEESDLPANHLPNLGKNRRDTQLPRRRSRPEAAASSETPPTTEQSLPERDTKTAGERATEQSRLVETAGAATRRMERNCRDQIKRLAGIFGLHTGKNQFGQVIHNPKCVVIFKSPQRRTDGSLVADGGTGAIKGGRFAGAGEAGVVVLDVARDRVAAEGAKRRLNFWGVRETVPADVFHRFR
jgi:hypothetical protein